MAKNVIFDKKNILVIGGAGFIGSHLCDELIKTNKVICLDNFSTGDERNIDHLLSDPNFIFIKHDIIEPINFDKMLDLQKFKIEFQGIQEIYNLACPMSPKSFEDRKIDTILANSYGTKNALDLAKKYEAKFIHFSSSVVYGYDRKDLKKIDETYNGSVNILSKRGAYDEGKRFSETLVAAYAEKQGVDVKILRLFRTYGPRMKLRDGQLIPDFIYNALDGADLTIYGDEEFESSFCYVDDVIDAAIKVADSDFHGPYNIGSDIPVNLTNLANIIIQKINSKSFLKYEKDLLFLKPLHIPDITRARNELGWMPVVSLDEGLDKTIYELRAHKDLKQIGS